MDVLNVRISQKKLIIFVVLGVVAAVVSTKILSFAGGMERTDDVVAYCVYLSLAVFAMELVGIYVLNKKLFDPIIIFLIIFYVFQNGQLLLYAQNVYFDMFYLNLMGGTIKEVAIFSSVSNIVAGFAGVIQSGAKNKSDNKYIINKIDVYGSNNIAAVGFWGFVVTAAVTIPLMMQKLPVAISGGYAALRAYESGVNSIVGFCEYMFVPFGLLCLVYDNQKLRRNTIWILMFMWFAATALCGDRTTGIAGLFVISYINYSIEQNKKTKMKNAIILVVVMAALIVFTRIAAEVRDVTGTVTTADEDYFLAFFTELGFSVFPLYMIMSIVPSNQPFMMGKSYISALISGCIPTFIDPTGTIAKIEDIAHINEKWQDVYFGQFDFGFGFSLNAEAYMNFGWYGLVAIFVVCFVIFHFFKKINFGKTEKNFDLYLACFLMFSWFTLPRRDSYYIWKALVFGGILISIYIHIVCGKLRGKPYRS